MKILLWSIVSMLIIGIAGGAFWWLRRPQVITFDSGDKVTLLAVEYGKKHTPPGIKTTATTTARARGGRSAAFTTATNTLVIWVRQEHDPQQYANFQYYLYDMAGTACVASYGGGGNGQQGSEVVGVQFPAFPRRQGKLILRVQEQGNNGQEVSDQKLVISNPARGPFSTWTAEPLPDAKDDDDLSVTLTKLAFGAAMPYTRNQDDPDDAMNKGVQATFNISQNGKPVTNWQPVSVETSDATGNRITGQVAKNEWDGNDDVVTYQYGLWPSEPAWKLRVEFSEQSGYSDGEVWSVTNIPLEPGRQQDFRNNVRNNTNSAFAETDLNGVHIKIFPAKQFTDAPPNSRQAGSFQMQITPPLPAEVRMTILKLTDDQGQDVQRNGSSTSRSAKSSTYGYQFGDLGNAKSLNFTIALHKSHFIEFTAKPTEAPAVAQ